MKWFYVKIQVPVLSLQGGYHRLKNLGRGVLADILSSLDGFKTQKYAYQL